MNIGDMVVVNDRKHPHYGETARVVALAPENMQRLNLQWELDYGYVKAYVGSHEIRVVLDD